MVSQGTSNNASVPMSWQGKRLTVLGLSRSGAAVARYVQRRGGDVFLSESLPASPNNEPLRKELEALGVHVEMGGHTASCYTHADTVITSPGIPPTNSILEELNVSGKSIWSEVELAYQEASAMTPLVPMIGITGTNGKSTTTTLISDILQAAGLVAPACGNIGLPILGILDDAQTSGKPLDYLVAELSSFQLHFSPKLKAKVAVFTNLTPDHLDWHGSLEGYENDKLRLFTGAQSPEWSVVNAADPFTKRIVAGTTGKVLGFATDKTTVQTFANAIYLTDAGDIEITLEGKSPETLLNVSQLQIIGDHNYENIMAAAATAILLGVPLATVKSACLSFKGLEHRLERVELPAAIQSPVVFYNDSKATNPESAISALRAFKKQPVVLLVGGYDKMTPLEPLAAEIRQYAKAVVLIGNARQRFYDAFEKAGITNLHMVEPPVNPSEPPLKAPIEEALKLSQALSQKAGDAPYPILFSPACASFDMFKNYEERGRFFKETVEQVLLASSGKQPALS